MITADCQICSGAADAAFTRRELWSNDLWRVTMHAARSLGGFCYIEPRRHIPSITDLSGDEAATFGPVIAAVTAALKAATKAHLIYVYIFGDHIAHLHVHLAPHNAQDRYCGEIIHGDVDETPMSDEEFASFRAAFSRV